MNALAPLPASEAPTRPVLRWHGGKWRLAPWIIGFFGPHRIYVEPYGGAASVLLRKPKSYSEVWNDLDEGLVNLFRVLRDLTSADDLIRRLELTPFARTEFEAAYAAVPGPFHDEASGLPTPAAVESARRLIVRSMMGFGSDSTSGFYRTGWRCNTTRSGTTPATDWATYPDILRVVAERTRCVNLESRPAIEVMARHDGGGVAALCRSSLFAGDPQKRESPPARTDDRALAWASNGTAATSPSGRTPELGRRFLEGLSEEQRDAFALLVEESRFGGALAWMFGSGFPKPATTADKAIDKHLGAAGEREVVGPRRYADGPVGHRSSQDVYAQDDWTKSQNGSGNVETAPASEEAAAWAGWGFALKPAHEPILLARKPLDGSHAANLLAHGTGALNIGGCRVEAGERPLRVPDRRLANAVYGPGLGGSKASGTTVDGRWPANVLHDGSDEVLAAFPGRPGPWRRCTAATATSLENAYGAFLGNIDEAGSTFRGDSGSAARFFYSSKATDGERVYRCRQCGAHRLGKPRCGHRDSHGNLDLASHPTVKPVELMRWLVRMVCPPGGLVLDPFAGTGTTGAAAQHERCDALLIEQSRDYAADICIRLGLPLGELAPAPVRAPPASDHGPLFGAAEAAE